jgi:glycerol-3-phosphate dehydrogenase
MQAHAMTRHAALAALADRVFDLLVIGGGITGCGIAREAALRGVSVALVEKSDFASGTSSRSSRLVHGGVRYLEHGQLHLVFESSAERRRLLRIAPHLVRPLQFTWPVYQGARIPRWKLSAGLTLYDALALFRNVGRHHRLDPVGVLGAEPMLEQAGLQGGASYFDAATNDARLTLANAIGAHEAGAVIVNHCAVDSLITEAGRIAGANVHDAMSDARVAVRARVVVNATGPWSGDVRAHGDGGEAVAVRGSKGVHIAVPRERVGNNGALTLLSPRDGRVLFVLPADTHAIVGTTDTFTSSLPDDARATNEDVRYLLESANHFFPQAALTSGDVVAAWAGIRPLLPTRDATPGAASREHAVTTSAQGLVSITGGKLTTFRVMARDVIAIVLERLNRRRGADPTRIAPLPGGDFDSLEPVIGAAARTTGDVDLGAHLAKTYGTLWPRVWAEIDRSDGRATVVDGLPYRMGELRYAIQSEMALTLGDLLIRRAHIAFETRDHGVSAAARAADVVAPLLGWNENARARALDDYAQEVARTFAID